METPKMYIKEFATESQYGYQFEETSILIEKDTLAAKLNEPTTPRFIKVFQESVQFGELGWQVIEKPITIDTGLLVQAIANGLHDNQSTDENQNKPSFDFPV